MSIRIITDSASDISLEYAKEQGVKVVPLSVTFDDQTSYKEDENFKLMEYYKRYETDKDFHVKTAQPSQREFYEAYTDLIKEGAEEIIVITISSGLSGTWNSAHLAAKMLNKTNKDVNVHIVDSLNASYASVFLVEEALELIKQGNAGAMIAEKLREKTKQIRTYLSLPTLKYLHKGGRISLGRYLLGSLLKKKPIVKVSEQGKNIAVDTVTELDEGIEKILELSTNNYTETPQKIAIIHAVAEDRVEKMKALIEEKLEGVEVRVILTGVTISAHTGPGVVALISVFE